MRLSDIGPGEVSGDAKQPPDATLTSKKKNPRNPLRHQSKHNFPSGVTKPISMLDPYENSQKSAYPIPLSPSTSQPQPKKPPQIFVDAFVYAQRQTVRSTRDRTFNSDVTQLAPAETREFKFSGRETGWAGREKTRHRNLITIYHSGRVQN